MHCAPRANSQAVLKPSALKVVPSTATHALSTVRTASQAVQDCCACRLQKACWSSQPRELDRTASLLACRIERGIERNRAFKALFKLFRSSFRKSATRLYERGAVPSVADGITELESQAALSLLEDYKLGERVTVHNWLFNYHTGAVVTYVRRVLRAQAPIEPYDDETSSSSDPAYAASSVEDFFVDQARRASKESFLRRVEDVLDDGLTFSSVEYRVLRFCFRAKTKHAQKELRRLLGLSQQQISSIYSEAVYRLIEALNLTEVYFNARGVSLPPRTRARRRAWFYRAARSSTPFEPDDVIHLVHLFSRARRPLKVGEIAWIYGVRTRTIYAILARFKAMTPAEIKHTMKPSKHSQASL